jgi:hypothetical protein
MMPNCCPMTSGSANQLCPPKKVSSCGWRPLFHHQVARSKCIERDLGGHCGSVYVYNTLQIIDKYTQHDWSSLDGRTPAFGITTVLDWCMVVDSSSSRVTPSHRSHSNPKGERDCDLAAQLSHCSFLS